LIEETEQGFVFTPCDWCKKNHAVVVYKSWILLCNKCYLRQNDEDVYEDNVRDNGGADLYQ
jgi:hypothetical protein